jgi:hypothetical protein
VVGAIDTSRIPISFGQVVCIVFTHLRTRLTLISTDILNKAVKSFVATCNSEIQIEASLTGHVYRVSHVFFSLSLASMTSVVRSIMSSLTPPCP